MTFDLDEYVYEAMKTGASGFLLKTAPASELAAAVRGVASGSVLVSPEITRRLIKEFVARPTPAGDAGTELPLTDREAEVLRLMAQGLSNREIAEFLSLSEATIKTHVNRILAKLGVRDRVQAVVLAYESGFVVPGRAGIPASGNEMDVKAIAIYRVQDGKIAEHWSAVDSAALLSQLGVIDLPHPG